MTTTTSALKEQIEEIEGMADDMRAFAENIFEVAHDLLYRQQEGQPFDETLEKLRGMSWSAYQIEDAARLAEELIDNLPEV